MKQTFIALLLLAAIGVYSQDSSWVKIRNKEFNGCEDVWVRRQSASEIAARAKPIHDTIYIDSFRDKIWAAAALLHRYAPLHDSVRYDTTAVFGHMFVAWTSRSGFIENGHMSKKRHSIRHSNSGEWISGDYYYVTRHAFEKIDTLGKFSSYDNARAFYNKKTHQYLAVDNSHSNLPDGERRYDEVFLMLDNYRLRQVYIGSYSFTTN